MKIRYDQDVDALATMEYPLTPQPPRQKRQFDFGMLRRKHS